jgi:hypothetical protein
MTRDYHRACEVVPELVQQETNIEQFLRVEQYRVYDTAVRIAKYWSYRKELFGERWLLPMTQTGTGALSPTHIEILRSGFVKVVPHTRYHGTLYVVDFTLLPSHVTSNVQLQIYFYLATILACDITILFVIRRGQRPMLAANGQLNYLRQVTPMRISKFMVAQVYEEGSEPLLNYLVYQQQRMTQINFQQQPIVMASNSYQSTLSLLQAHGFDATCLPRELGGTIDPSYFENWVRTRLSIEDIMGAAPILRRHTRTLSSQATMTTMKMMPAITTTTTTTNNSNTSLVGVVPPPFKKVKRGQEYPSLVQGPNESNEEFAKRKNACQVRRNYHRQKMVLLTTQGLVDQAKAQRVVLQTEYHRLRTLWNQAVTIVQQLEQQQTPQPPPPPQQSLQQYPPNSVLPSSIVSAVSLPAFVAAAASPVPVPTSLASVSATLQPDPPVTAAAAAPTTQLAATASASVLGSTVTPTSPSGGDGDDDDNDSYVSILLQADDSWIEAVEY